MADQKIGQLMDSLGVELDIREGDQIIEAFVIVKTSNFEDGGTGVNFGTSEGMDWIAQLGLYEGVGIILRRNLSESL